MKIKALKYQVSAFGNQAVEPSPDNIKRGLDYFVELGYLPASVQEPDAMGGVVQRLSMQSATAGMMINFLNGRVDILRQMGFPGVSEGGDISEFIVGATNGINKAEQSFRQQYNRVALVSDYMVTELSVESLAALRNRLLPSTPLEPGVEPFEWDAKWGVRFAFGQIGEETNVIATIGRHPIQVMDQYGARSDDALICQIDINTVPENQKYRCDEDYRKRFFEDAFEQHKKVYDRMMGELS